MKTEVVFQHEGDTYTIGVVDAFEQFHLFRRMTPLISSMGVEMFKIMSGQTDVAKLGKAAWIMAAAPIMDQLAVMPQEDVNYLLVNTLKVVKKKQGDSFAPMLSSTGKLMYQDTEMATVLRLVMEVLRHNLGDFFPIPRSEEPSSDEDQFRGTQQTS